MKYKMRNTQVRLDLELFTLVDPDETGNCRTDYMQVTLGLAPHGALYLAPSGGPSNPVRAILIPQRCYIRLKDGVVSIL